MYTVAMVVLMVAALLLWLLWDFYDDSYLFIFLTQEKKEKRAYQEEEKSKKGVYKVVMVAFVGSQKGIIRLFLVKILTFSAEFSSIRFVILQKWGTVNGEGMTLFVFYHL